jgi:hypothetical protein
MQLTTIRFRRCASRLLTVFVAALFVWCPSGVAADPFPKTPIPHWFSVHIEGPKVKFDESVMTVHIPLHISDMPGGWKNASLFVGGVVRFADANGKTTAMGYPSEDAFNKHVDEMPLPIPMYQKLKLDNGAYSGNVNVPISEVLPMGSQALTVTANTCAVGYAFAKLNDSIMVIGSSSVGAGTAAGDCSPDLKWLPGTIINLNQ